MVHLRAPWGGKEVEARTSIKSGSTPVVVCCGVVGCMNVWPFSKALPELPKSCLRNPFEARLGDTSYIVLMMALSGSKKTGRSKSLLVREPKILLNMMPCRV
jgi:hypothetical protein